MYIAVAPDRVLDTRTIGGTARGSTITIIVDVMGYTGTAANVNYEVPDPNGSTILPDDVAIGAPDATHHYGSHHLQALEGTVDADGNDLSPAPAIARPGQGNGSGGRVDGVDTGPEWQRMHDVQGMPLGSAERLPGGGHRLTSSPIGTSSSALPRRAA